ncbi:hypothetical protein Tsubulata_014041, partial [Turnera subulata]
MPKEIIAFTKAWNDICEATNNPTMNIPEGKTFLLGPTTFQGPCKSASVTIQLDGTIVAPKSTTPWSGSNYHTWLQFRDVNGLTIKGNGQLNEQGEFWWAQKDKIRERPAALSFFNSKNLTLNGFSSINSPGGHMVIVGSDDSTISNLTLTASGKSPNTDGIKLSYMSNVHIHDCNIGTGWKGVTTYVEQVHVRDCNFKGTTNGIRIKTKQGGQGYVKNVTYENISFDGVANPIIIDQFYGDLTNQTEAVKVSDITYTNVHGTFVKDEAVVLKCSDSVSCSNLIFNNVTITSATHGKAAKVLCNHATGKIDNYSIPKIN